MLLPDKSGHLMVQASVTTKIVRDHGTSVHRGIMDGESQEKDSFCQQEIYFKLSYVKYR